jgi:hypothetical protein
MMSLSPTYFSHINVPNDVRAGLVLCPYVFEPLLNMGLVGGSKGIDLTQSGVFSLNCRPKILLWSSAELPFN